MPAVDGAQSDQMVTNSTNIMSHSLTNCLDDALLFSDHQWLQMDLGPATLVNGIVTRGRGDKKNWVTSYSLSYSNDTQIWFYYKDANHLEAKVANSTPQSQNFHVSPCLGSC